MDMDKSGKKRKKKENRPSKKEESLEKSWRPFLKQTFFISLFVILFAGFLQALEKSILKDPLYRISSKSLKLGKLPEWAASKQIARDLHLPFGSVSIFDENLEEKIRKNFLKHAWVEDVVSVKRELPRGIRLQVVVRKPVARVRMNFDYYLVDASARVLPREFYYLEKELPLITGMDRSVPKAGEIWQDSSLLRALDLLALWETRNISGKYPRIQLNKIQCALPREKLAGQPDLIIHLNQRMRLFFNVGDDEGELNLDLAFDNLEKILFRDPDLGRLSNYVDLRWRRPALQ
jgi:cell division septal protein FtsQ